MLMQQPQHAAIDVTFQSIQLLLRRQLISGKRLKHCHAAITQDGLQRAQMLPRAAMSNGVNPGRIVTNHSADGAAICGRGVRCKM